MSRPSVSVVICAYSDARWSDLCASVSSLLTQRHPPDQIIVVIDHNDDLLRRARNELTGAAVVPNDGPKGLSGARNTGIRAAHGEVVAFLDDDAIADPDWIVHLTAPYSDPSVLGVGGWAEPAFDETPPGWLPEEFWWVIGCSHRGLPRRRATVRNLIGCNMSIRADVAEAVGGFDTDLGRTADRPLGCEETELCIRAVVRFPGGRFVLEPAAIVRHRVRPDRTTWQYFRSRCLAEGVSKAWVAQLVGSDSALSSERAHALRVLPVGVVRNLVAIRPADADGLRRALAIVAGLAYTTRGFLAERRALGRRSPAVDANAVPMIIDLAEPIPMLGDAGSTAFQARCLVVVRGAPIGRVVVDVPADGLDPEFVAKGLWSELGPEISAAVARRGLDRPTSLPGEGFDLGDAPDRLVDPRASVVVATRNRPDDLAQCIASILDGAVVPAQLIVVDNDPDDDRTATLVARLAVDHPSLVYVREDRAGLAHAHNVGLARVGTDLVAFTDDDVVVHRWWLSSIIAAFDVAPDVACVTGMIAPLELDTEVQRYIEAQAAFGKGLERRVFHRDAESGHPLFPFAAGLFGSGANMAFRTSTLRGTGGFDEALGAGTEALGGDDLAAFYDVITAGHHLVYEPAAIVSHRHHRDVAALARQAYGYGAGLTAHLARCAFADPRTAATMAARALSGLRRAAEIARPPAQLELPPAPVPLTLLHARGMLSGPRRYRRSRRSAA